VNRAGDSRHSTGSPDRCGTHHWHLPVAATPTPASSSDLRLSSILCPHRRHACLPPASSHLPHPSPTPPSHPISKPSHLDVTTHITECPSPPSCCTHHPCYSAGLQDLTVLSASSHLLLPATSALTALTRACLLLRDLAHNAHKLQHLPPQLRKLEVTVGWAAAAAAGYGSGGSRPPMPLGHLTGLLELRGSGYFALQVGGGPLLAFAAVSIQEPTHTSTPSLAAHFFALRQQRYVLCAALCCILQLHFTVRVLFLELSEVCAVLCCAACCVLYRPLTSCRLGWHPCRSQTALWPSPCCTSQPSQHSTCRHTVINFDGPQGVT
jgi:hypothetical protein